MLRARPRHTASNPQLDKVRAWRVVVVAELISKRKHGHTDHTEIHILS
jgi:hypothetical protein